MPRGKATLSRVSLKFEKAHPLPPAEVSSLPWYLINTSWSCPEGRRRGCPSLSILSLALSFWVARLAPHPASQLLWGGGMAVVSGTVVP